LRLLGPGAERFVIHADALFLGAAVVSRRGREIELLGSGGADPLVGLRVDVAPMASAIDRNDPRISTGASGGVKLGARSEPRVRVFRARAGS
jgi:hypothetical protein